ncbi:DNA adenine methylase [Weissella sagaensis]|uniref:Site-specific DNA-methyltransferase (adenine-specific) n=1 Tax=Weissella sagaensis TaxID=2559928 RepID=A0ABW1RRQ3_9LACO|nr:DNA adenine methylase [Weissella sagaensis]
MNKNPLVKPFVKWAGGKRQLLPQINENTPKNFKKYYEPFVGGGAVFLDKQLKKVVINDFNSELTNAYQVVKDSSEELLKLLETHSENNSSDYYYQVRAWDRDGTLETKSEVERAARFIYLNKTGFNGLFRVNSHGQVNVPYGKYKNPAIVNEAVIRAVSKYLQKSDITILNGDYGESLKDVKKNDFVYLDPPYADVTNDKKSFVGYTLNGFGDEEQERLRDVFKELDAKGAYVMMSNSSTSYIHELYKEYSETTRIVKAKRAINSKASGRGAVDEVLIMNYKI